jgi:adenosylcobinamide-phosphate guanylyltransferase
MIGIVMAGGKGNRMFLQEEKLLLKYKKPIISHVIDALKNSKCFTKIIAITSYHSPKTRELLQNSGIEIFETPGDGFVTDLNLILKTLNDDVLVVPGDLPLLDEQIILQLVQRYDHSNLWTSYLISRDFSQSLGLTSEFSTIFQNKECYYSGISIINAKEITDLTSIKENYKILDDKRIALNLNTKEDYDLLSTT